MTNVSYNEETHTLTNHDLDKTYVFGRRGKRASWVQEWVNKHGIPEYKTEETVIDPSEYKVSFDKDSNTFTNHTLGKTYTYGQRGKKASWVVMYEKKEGIEVPPKRSPSITPVNAEDIEYKITFDEYEGIITNHTLDKKYAIGQRGNKPLWVRAWLDENQDKVVSPTNNEKRVVDPTNSPTPKYNHGPDGLREWHFKSEMNNQCIIVAKNELDAIKFYNKNTKFPLTAHAMEIFWRETDYVCNFSEGIWRFDTSTDTWESYGDYKTRMEKSRLGRVESMIENAEAEEAAVDAFVED